MKFYTTVLVAFGLVLASEANHSNWAVMRVHELTTWMKGRDGCDVPTCPDGSKGVPISYKNCQQLRVEQGRDGEVRYPLHTTFPSDPCRDEAPFEHELEARNVRWFTRVAWVCLRSEIPTGPHLPGQFSYHFDQVCQDFIITGHCHETRFDTVRGCEAV